MDPFEFFFSFYGLLLGFSVAELVGGFARLLHERRTVRFGYLTPLLALFVAIDIASFWNQAWVIFRPAPYNYALLIVGLAVASTFYVAATQVFPRELKPGEDLDDHFWARKRLVLLSVMGANLLIAALFVGLISLNGEFAKLRLGPGFWVGTPLFMVLTLAAALARRRWIVTTALVVLLAYQTWQILGSAKALIDKGGWLLTGG
ncbi:hypothetical protein CFHF_00150 [Caulobacter flavus]|uniref:Tripartite tricarboxylate transporter TctB family protein n=1 Tax=Caulobacter flavus TaxID=1679497 RepID=A0A2N5D7G4_9CAUL|nr:hypothetical protein [Caulobacter flavus]AYV45510.1 hypothetical protein C1707_04190 [Caulobacter flavus]PLR21982.1 hypothetical protein CFHF_00150 [Caulobacter flavus]